VPSFEELAKATRIGTKKKSLTLEQNYQLNYRRLCMFAHCDSRTPFRAARFEHLDELPLPLVEATAAALFAIQTVVRGAASSVAVFRTAKRRSPPNSGDGRVEGAILTL